MASPKVNPSGPAAASQSAAANPSATKLSERYLLCGTLASGGMATVHLGRLLGPAAFARVVAIKRLLPQYAHDPDFRLMLADEARLAARIRHPNVVQVMDVVTQGEELFIVMEYVDGASLRRLASSSPDKRVPQPILASILCHVLHGLHAAHEASDEAGNPLSIVHRDVSPDNVLVGADGLARVLDFGVAKATSRLQRTREGQLKGRLAYMAPEQLRGNATRQSDVFSASIIFWEGLVGKRLFRADDDGETIGRVLAAVVDPPSSLVSSVDARVDEIVMRGLRLDLNERWATAREMAMAIEKDVRLATATEIGEWVQSLEGAALAERRALVLAAESAEPPQEPSLGVLTRVSWATFADTGAPSRPREGRRRRVAPVVAAVGAIAAAGLAIGWMAGTRPTAAANGASSASGSTTSPVSAAAVAVPPADVSGPLSPSTDVAPAKPPARPAGRRVGPSTTAPPATSKVPAKNDCDPPYHLGPLGEKIWIKSCL